MNKLTGYSFILIALIFGSLKPIFIKHGFIDISIPALSMMGLLAITSGILSFFLNRPKVPIPGKDFGALLFLSFLMLCYTLANVVALKHSNVVTVTAIVALTPLVIGVHQAIRKKQKLSNYFYLGFLIAFCGVMLVIDLTDLNKLNLNTLGIAFSLLTVATADIYRIKLEDMSQSLKHMAPAKISSYMLILCGFLSLTLLPIEFKHILKEANESFWTVLLLASVCWVFANQFFVKSIKEIGATSVSMVCISQPAIVMIFAVFILSQPLYFNQILGILILITGVLISEVSKIKVTQKNSSKITSLNSAQ